MLVLGLLGAILFQILNLGLLVLATFMVLLTIPMAVFFVFLYRGQRRTLFWTAETALLVVGMFTILSGLVIPTPISELPFEIGAIYIVLYFAFLLLVLLALGIVWAIMKSRLIAHNLDQLSVGIAGGKIQDTSSIWRRFESIMKSWWAGEFRQFVLLARFLGGRKGVDLNPYTDRVVYQWIVETLSRTPFPEWFEENEPRLREMFGDRLVRQD